MVHYDAIPLLTLLSSCLSLIINIIGRLYRFRDHDSKTLSENHDNDHDVHININI